VINSRFISLKRRRLLRQLASVFKPSAIALRRRSGTRETPVFRQRQGLNWVLTGRQTTVTATATLMLGIETTCDETAAAVVERQADGSGRILSNVIRSQVDEHAPYGGVVPEIAARAHVDLLDGIIASAMKEAAVTYPQLSGVAAAAGPGLIGGVIVGLTTAKAIALVHAKPLLAVNHLEAHALTPRLVCPLAFPYCLFLASGGHTQIVAVLGVGQYVRLGTTVDDAIGEAFDKVAKMLGLPYPGGPQVERLAATGDPNRFPFPRPMLGRKDANFSLSGLKTAVRNEAERSSPLDPQDIGDLCAGFQAAVLESTADRLTMGLTHFQERFGTPRALVAAGGVAANQAIRGALQAVAARAQTALIVPPPALCTDNGAMIGWAGLERLALGLTDEMAAPPRARWKLDNDAPTLPQFANTRAQH
jgi:N6-L-threonylcarbamoyladenine synthase